MEKILLGPSGGTAASMGAFMKYWVQQSGYTGETWLVPEMWKTMVGLTDRQLVLATRELVEKWHEVGGSPKIPSCKNTNVFKIGSSEKNMSSVVREFCKGYEGIIAVGGGGTTRQCTRLRDEQGINSIVALATMDNDICCFDDVLGFKTAVENLAISINACVNDAQTMQRPTIVYAMGYESGRLAASAVKYARKTYGTKVDLLHIPETNVAIEDVVAQIKNKYKGGGFTIVISEGVCKSTGTSDGIHKEFSTSEYAEKLMQLSGIKFKVLTPDYNQRSGIPVNGDKMLALKFAEKAGQLVREGKWNHVIGSIDGNVVAKPFEEIIEVLNTQDSSSNWYVTSKMSLSPVEDILIK